MRLTYRVKNDKNDSSFFFKIFNLFIHERHTDRKAETQAEGEADSMQGANMGLDPGSPGGDAKPQSYLGCPTVL